MGLHVCISLITPQHLSPATLSDDIDHRASEECWFPSFPYFPLCLSSLLSYFHHSFLLSSIPFYCFPLSFSISSTFLTWYPYVCDFKDVSHQKFNEAYGLLQMWRNLCWLQPWLWMSNGKYLVLIMHSSIEFVNKEFFHLPLYHFKKSLSHWRLNLQIFLKNILIFKNVISIHCCSTDEVWEAEMEQCKNTII